MSFRAGEDCARRDARVAHTARSLPMHPRTFIAAESEFLLYAGSPPAVPPVAPPPPLDRLRRARSPPGRTEPTSNRIPPGIGPSEETPEYTLSVASLYTYRGILSSFFCRVELAQSSSGESPSFIRAIYADFASSRVRHSRDYDNFDEEIERLRDLAFRFSL